MYQNLTHFEDYFLDVQRIPFVIAALFVTAVFGMITGPAWGNANPFVWHVLDVLFGRLGGRMDRSSRTPRDLKIRGLVFALLLLLFALFIGRGLLELTLQSSAIEGLIVVLCLSTGSVWYMVLKLYFVLDKQGNTKGGYFGLARSSRVDLNSMDDYGIVREGLAYSAISFDKGFVAPSLWYLIGGVPFLIIYSVLAFGAWRFGKCGHTKGFGITFLVLERLLGFVPSVFSGLLYTATSVVAPSVRMADGFKAWWQGKDKAPYEQGGMILSALAWPLGVSLGGPVRDIDGHYIKKEWVGPDGASARVDAHHLRRGIIINVAAHLMFLLALLSAYIYAGRLF